MNSSDRNCEHSAAGRPTGFHLLRGPSRPRRSGPGTLSRAIGLAICVLVCRGPNAARAETGWFPPILPADQAEQELEAHNASARAQGMKADDYYALGALYLLHTPSTDLAAAYLRQAVRLQADDPMAAFLYSLVLERRGYYTKASKPLLAICRHEPDRPIAELAARTIASYQGYVKDFSAAVEPVFRRLLRRDDYQNPDFVHTVKKVLVRIYEAEDRRDQEKEVRISMGEVTHWIVTDPFGHLPNLDFDTPFPPESEASPSKEYVQDDRKTVARDEVFEGEPVRPFGKGRREGTYYASTYLQPQAAQKVIFRLNTRDRLRLFVNGKQVFTHDTRRQWQRQDRTLVLSLRSGWHRLLVKSNSDTIPAGFRLWLTDLSGNALPGAEGRTAFEEFPETVESEALTPEPVPSTVERYAEQLLTTSPADPWGLFVKAWMAGEAGNMAEARVNQEKCLEAAPHFAEFHFYLARYCKDDPSLSVEDSSARARQEFLKASELAEDFATALDEVSDFDLDENHHLRAIRTRQRCVAINPYYWGYHLSLFSAYRAKGWNDRATESIERAFELNPEAQYLLTLGREWFQGRRNFRREADCQASLERVLSKSSQKAQRLVGHQELPEAAREYLRLIALKPREPTLRSSLAEVYRRMGQFDKAKGELAQLLGISPHPGRVNRALATVLFEEGDTEAGLEELRKALRESPTDRSLRRALSALGETDELEGFRVSLEKVLKERDPKRKYEGVSTAYLLDQYVSRVFPDGSSLDLTHIIAKVLDKGGVQRMGEIRVPRNAHLYNLRVVKPSGETLEPEIITKKDSYSMSGLAPGDIVQYEYLSPMRKLSIPKAYRGANFTFNSIETPTERAQLVVLTPPKYPLQYRFRNAKVEPKIEERPDVTVYRWDMKNPKAVHREPRPVPYQEYIPHVQFSGGLTWDNVRLEYANRLIPQLTVSPEMEAAAVEALQGVTAPDQRAERIFRMAEDRIKRPTSSTYLGQPAHVIYSERSGNMLIVLKALYDHFGIPADVFFAYSQTQALPVLEVPSLGVFRYGLIRLTLPEKGAVWIEPAQSRLPFGYFSPAFGGTQALLVLGPGETMAPVPQPPSEQDHVAMRWQGRISRAGEIEVDAEETFSGVLAGAMRRLAENYTDQQWTQFLERNLSHSVRGATVTNVRLADLEDYERPVTLKYQFRAPGYARLQGETLRIEQVFGKHNMVRRFAPLPGRRISLLLPSPVSDTIETVLVFPEGSRPIRTPRALKLKTPFGQYEATVEAQSHVLKVARSLQQPIQRVSPKSYPSYARFCQSIDENEVYEIAVQLPK